MEKIIFKRDRRIARKPVITSKDSTKAQHEMSLVLTLLESRSSKK
jgi:hypothetical protein